MFRILTRSPGFRRTGDLAAATLDDLMVRALRFQGWALSFQVHSPSYFHYFAMSSPYWRSISRASGMEIPFPNIKPPEFYRERTGRVPVNNRYYLEARNPGAVGPKNVE